MTVTPRPKRNQPRVYLTLKDAVSKETRGVTVQGASISEVLAKIQETFSPSHRRETASTTPQSVAQKSAGALKTAAA